LAAIEVGRHGVYGHRPATVRALLAAGALRTDRDGSVTSAGGGTLRIHHA
jgi:hypothetical protein